MDIREFLNNIPPEEIEKINKEQIAQNEAFYKDFKEAYKKNCCSLCGNRIDYFNKNEKCFHWFLYPTGIRKKDFADYLKQPIGYFKLESYLRWIASMETPLKNINDLSDEVSESKIKEITIRHKNIEWSLNFGSSDKAGHLDSKNANFPHFHLQMLINEQPFIGFNDFHIPFSKEDLFNLELLEKAKDLIKFRNDYGEGMSMIEEQDILLELENNMKISSDEENATFHTRTIFQLPDGKTMSGEILEKVFQESKETKIPARHLIKKYYPDVQIITEICPGKGVPEMKKRSRR